MTAPGDPYEPGGDIWRESLARRGGREYLGGPVCWSECEGICRTCHHTETAEAPTEEIQ